MSIYEFENSKSKFESRHLVALLESTNVRLHYSKLSHHTPNPCQRDADVTIVQSCGKLLLT